MPAVLEKSKYFSPRKPKPRQGPEEEKASPRRKLVPLSSSSSRWVPPRSPYHLVQEDLFHDPFKLLVATIFLNRTGGDRAVPLALQFLRRWPDPRAVAEAEEDQIADLLQPLGLNRRRAKVLQRFSREYMTKDWTYPIELYGIGKYGNDSFRIFCVEEWRMVRPKDKMLNKYHEWLMENF